MADPSSALLTPQSTQKSARPSQLEKTPQTPQRDHTEVATSSATTTGTLPATPAKASADASVLDGRADSPGTSDQPLEERLRALEVWAESARRMEETVRRNGVLELEDKVAAGKSALAAERAETKLQEKEDENRLQADTDEQTIEKLRAEALEKDKEIEELKAKVDALQARLDEEEEELECSEARSSSVEFSDPQDLQVGTSSRGGDDRERARRRLLHRPGAPRPLYATQNKVVVKTPVGAPTASARASHHRPKSSSKRALGPTRANDLSATIQQFVESALASMNGDVAHPAKRKIPAHARLGESGSQAHPAKRPRMTR